MAGDWTSSTWARDYQRPEDYKQELLAAVNDAYVNYRHSNVWGHEFVSAAVDGSYPTTRLIIRFRDPASRGVHSHSYPVWGEDGLAEPAEGGPEDPQQAADIVAMWLDEPLDPNSPFYGEQRAET